MILNSISRNDVATLLFIRNTRESKHKSYHGGGFSFGSIQPRMQEVSILLVDLWYAKSGVPQAMVLPLSKKHENKP